jgi:hypothetical protein
MPWWDPWLVLEPSANATAGSALESGTARLRGHAEENAEENNATTLLVESAVDAVVALEGYAEKSADALTVPDFRAYVEIWTVLLLFTLFAFNFLYRDRKRGVAGFCHGLAGNLSRLGHESDRALREFRREVKVRFRPNFKPKTDHVDQTDEWKVVIVVVVGIAAVITIALLLVVAKP